MGDEEELVPDSTSMPLISVDPLGEDNLTGTAQQAFAWLKVALVHELSGSDECQALLISASVVLEGVAQGIASLDEALLGVSEFLQISAPICAQGILSGFLEDSTARPRLLAEPPAVETVAINCDCVPDATSAEQVIEAETLADAPATELLP